MIKTKNNWIIFSNLFLLFFLSLPQKTFAVLVDESSTAAVGLLAWLNPITTYLFGIMTQLLHGLVYLITSAQLLQIAVNNSPAWIDVNSLFVLSGLKITTTLADMLLIAVFIAIALGTVFNVESINAKKFFIKFCIVALLVHFAPLFVGMITDISNIITRGLMVGNEGLFTSLFNQLGIDILLSIGALAASFLSGATLGLTGTLGIAANYGAIALSLLNLFIGVPHYIIQIMTVNIIAGLTFSYAMFFLTRVFVIQILTVLAPLAILASVLPQTKKYFEMWKQWIIGWSFGSILVLFLLTLGLTCIDLISNLPQNTTASVGFGDWAINLYMNWQFRWIALAVYMITVESICLSAIPPLAKQFSEKVNQETSKAGRAFSGMYEKIGKSRGITSFKKTPRNQMLDALSPEKENRLISSKQEKQIKK